LRIQQINTQRQQLELITSAPNRAEMNLHQIKLDVFDYENPSDEAD
jgi:hypothetical protein